MLIKLKDILDNYIDIDLNDITEESRLVEDIGLNSYEFMSLIGEIEDEFDIEVEEREVVKIRTIGEILNYIRSLQEEYVPA